MTILPPVPAPRNRWLPLVLITILTLAFLIVSIVLINLGQGLIFIPIIFACMYYVKRGFVFSVILVCVYSILTLSLSHDPNVLLLAVIRVPIFILVAGVITYLSLQKIRGEETLRESEERYRNVIEDQTEFICRFLPDGTHIFVNDAYCRYFDKKREDIIGHRFKPVLYPEEQEIVALHIASITPEHPVIDIDQRIMMPDGSTRWQRWSDRAIFDPDGRAVEYQSVGRDITERKQAEEALLQASRKLAMLNSITRHDILNQLMGLRTYLELSKMDVSDPVFLNYIQKEEQAAEAIQWQIEFTKNYQDIGGQAPKWQNMSDTIGSAVSQLKPSGVEINVAVDRAEVFADPLLEKVFYNLMENSLRHGEHVTRMDFSVKKSESGFILTYADNGVGVTLDEKKKLFQKGFGKHTGLGLFLSKEILFITGITITENGEPGKGARFELTVPNGAWRMKGNGA
jgi:PAS domain S-box-containing protein